MKVLALVPPCKNGRRVARYPFLDEELRHMSRQGVKVHAVSKYVKNRKKVEGITIHLVPRLRRAWNTMRSLKWLDSSTKNESIRARISLAQILNTINRVVIHEKIDVIYSPFAWPQGTAGVPVAEKHSVPLVVSLRGIDVMVDESIGFGSTLNNEFRTRIQAALIYASHVLGVSSHLVHRGIELGASYNKSTVILKGTHEAIFLQGDQLLARKQLGLHNRPTVLFVGGFQPYKDPMTLARAFQEISTKIPSAQLVLCGKGILETELRSFFETKNLKTSVVFAGYIERTTMPAYFQACDVFVLPSIAEGSGNVLVEAAACEKPSVGANAGGIPDYIDDGTTGFLFEPRDHKDLAEKVCTLLNNEELRVRMGKSARARVEEKHRYDDIIDQIIAVLKTVAKENKIIPQTGVQ